MGDALSFEVDRTAAPDISILHDSAEGVDSPIPWIGGHHVDVVDESDCTLAAAALEPRIEVCSPGTQPGRVQDLDLDAFPLEDAPEEVSTREFVARRVRGVDADIVRQ